MIDLAPGAVPGGPGFDRLAFIGHLPEGPDGDDTLAGRGGDDTLWGGPEDNHADGGDDACRAETRVSCEVERPLTSA